MMERLNGGTCAGAEGAGAEQLSEESSVTLI
jgi:hypothetical protein